MELLIVLGLCFGAYELLGVFQGCFHNDHPLPYQTPLHSKGNNSANNSSSKNNNNQNDETKDEDDEQLSEKREDDVDNSEYQIVEKGNKLKSVIEAYNSFSRIEKNALNGLNKSSRVSEEGDAEEEEGGEPCSCYSTTTEFDDFENDDTRTILRNNKRKINSRKNHPINKFSLSSSLMSLNRDDLNLFNYFEDGISSGSCTSKFSKFKSETQVFGETSFNEISSNREDDYDNDSNAESTWRSNEIRRKSNNFNFLETTAETYNEINSIRRNTNPTVDDSTQKKIFFISAAS